MAKMKVYNGTSWVVAGTYAENVDYNNADSGLNSSNTQAAIDELKEKIDADAAQVISATLLASAWSGTSAPYTYNLTVSGVTATSIQEILAGDSVTLAQLTALQNANIQGDTQSLNTIVLKAWGIKPTIDLPVKVIIYGDLYEDESPQIIEITADTTLALTHAEHFLKVNSDSAINITVLSNTSVSFPLATQIEICRYGSGAVTIIVGESTYSIPEQYSIVVLKYLGDNAWIIKMSEAVV